MAFYEFEFNNRLHIGGDILKYLGTYQIHPTWKYLRNVPYHRAIHFFVPWTNRYALYTKIDQDTWRLRYVGASIYRTKCLSIATKL